MEDGNHCCRDACDCCCAILACECRKEEDARGVEPPTGNVGYRYNSSTSTGITINTTSGKKNTTSHSTGYSGGSSHSASYAHDTPTVSYGGGGSDSGFSGGGCSDGGGGGGGGF